MFRFLLIAILLTGCNSIYLKPNTFDTTQTVYADRGGFSMRRSVKEQMEKRGYNIVVGDAHATRDIINNNENIELDSNGIPDNVRYVIKVSERGEKFNPFWCPLNGFWWWNFNMSIADQKTGEELMTWRGRGCAHSSLRKLDKILDKLEMHNDI